MLRSAILNSVAALALFMAGVASQSLNCNFAEVTAKEFAAANECGCTALPTCGSCASTGLDGLGGSVVCSNGCTYCDSSQEICGVYSSGVARSETQVDTGSGFLPVAVVSLTFSYSWLYTKGREGTLLYTAGDGICSLLIDSTSCQSCSLTTCDDGTLQPTIDCTNVEAGATATACSGRLGNGYASLDESALTGVLAPLAGPFYLCEQGVVVLEASGDASTSSADGSLPAGEPVEEPAAAPASVPAEKPAEEPATISAGGSPSGTADISQAADARFTGFGTKWLVCTSILMLPWIRFL